MKTMNRPLPDQYFFWQTAGPASKGDLLKRFSLPDPYQTYLALRDLELRYALPWPGSPGKAYPGRPLPDRTLKKWAGYQEEPYRRPKQLVLWLEVCGAYDPIPTVRFHHKGVKTEVFLYDLKGLSDECFPVGHPAERVYLKLRSIEYIVKTSLKTWEQSDTASETVAEKTVVRITLNESKESK